MNSWSIWFAAVVLCAHSVAAQGENPDGVQQQARAAYEEGKQAFQEGRYAQAASAFRKAYRLKPTWKLLYNLGQAEAAAKRYGLALEAFERYLAMGGDEVTVDKREEVLGEIQKLRLLVGFVEVAAPEGTVIYVDKMERGVAPLPGRIKVTAGVEHILVAERNGAILSQRPFVVSGQETLTIHIKAEQPLSYPAAHPAPTGEPAAQPAAPLPKNEDAAPASPAESGPASRAPQVSAASAAPGAGAPGAPADRPVRLAPWGIAAASTGAALLAAGAVSGAVALSKKKELDGSPHCDGTRCTPEERDTIDAMQRAAALSTALFVAGGVVAATGVTLLVLAKIRGNADRPVALQPAVVPTAVGIVAKGVF